MAQFAYTPEQQAELDAAFARLSAGEDFNLGATDETPVPDEEEESVPDEEDPDAEPEDGDDEESSSDDDEEEESEPDAVDLGDGRTATKAELAQLARLRDHLQANPQLAASLDASTQYAPRPVEQRAPAAPTYTPPQPPEELDLDDPAIRALWDLTSGLHQQVESQRQELLRRQAVESASDVERAVGDWNSRYKLSDEQLADIRLRAARLNVAGNMVANGISVFDATVNVLEAAFWSDPNLRDQYLNAHSEDLKATEKTQRAKTRKLGAIAGRGTTASSPKPPSEMTRDERRTAMTNEIADYLARN